MANDTLRADMVEQVRDEQGRRTRAPRASKPVPMGDSQPPTHGSSVASAPSGHAADEADAGAGQAAGAPRKRRRRRKPAGDRAGGDAGAAPMGGSEP